MTTVYRLVQSPIVLVAAYGRRYFTKEAAVKDWNDGKDFQIYNGPYCSKRDTKKLREISSGVFIQYEKGTIEV